MAIQPKMRIAAADYYQRSEYTQYDLIQLIDGEVIVGVPPTTKHQAIVGEILFLLMQHAKEQGGKAFTSPIEVYLDEHNIYEPDVLYLTPDSDCIIEEKRLRGAPDLVVEVLSPSTAKYDRQNKYDAYEQHGVREYWIVDPVHELLEVWTLNEGQFIRQGAYATVDSFNSSVLGKSVAVQTFLLS